MNYKQSTRIATLIFRKVQDRITVKEDIELRRWATADVENQNLIDKFLDPNWLIPELLKFKELESDTDHIWDRLRVKFPSLPALPKIEARA